MYDNQHLLCNCIINNQKMLVIFTKSLKYNKIKPGDINEKERRFTYFKNESKSL